MSCILSSHRPASGYTVAHMHFYIFIPAGVVFTHVKSDSFSSFTRVFLIILTEFVSKFYSACVHGMWQCDYLECENIEGKTLVLVH